MASSAKVGALMSNKGELDGTRLMSESTWLAMHGKAKESCKQPYTYTYI